VLDEAANICKIADLPKLYSHLGSRGIVPVTILQSYPQGAGVWGAAGMDTLWAASTVKLIGAGLDDDKFLEKVSRLVGEHDVAIRSVHHGQGSHGENLSVRRQRILAVEDLRQLPKGQALLLATGCRPALLELRPWYDGRQAVEIRAAYDETIAALTARANASDAQEAAPQGSDAEGRLRHERTADDEEAA
jgi:type IV secretory pathway TraG/TraD family ATPase VirD4